MMTKEREKLKVDWKASFEALEKENAELMRELDRVRAECIEKVNEIGAKWERDHKQMSLERDQLRADLVASRSIRVQRESRIGYLEKENAQLRAKLDLEERRLGNAYRMCRELMEPDAFQLFKDSQDKIEGEE